MNGIGALIKRPQRASLSLGHMRRQPEDGVWEPGSRRSPHIESAHAMILDFPAPQSRRNKSLLFTIHPVCVISVTEAQTD